MEINRKKKQHNSEDERPPKQSFHGDLPIKILCVLAAFCLWVYVMQVESPEYEQVFTNITVDLDGVDELNKNGITVYSGGGQVVDVTLSGRKSILSKLTKNDIVVTADLSGLEANAQRTSCRVIVDVPADCRLVGTSQEYIPVYLDEETTVKVDLTEDRGNTRLPDGCTTGLIQFQYDQLSVTGPKKTLEKIAKAVVEIDLTGVSKTTTMTKKVILVDKTGVEITNPYLKFSSEVTLTIPVLKTATVPVEIDFLYDYFSEDNAEIALTPAFIDVTGDPSVIDSGKLIEPIEINEKMDFNNMVCQRTILLEAVSGVTLSSSYVELLIEADPIYKTREITVPSENIKDTGGKTGVKYSWEENPMTVTIMGPIDAISQITPEDITIKLDMSPYDDSNTGSIRVRGQIDIDSEYEEQVIDVGIYYVTVTFGE